MDYSRQDAQPTESSDSGPQAENLHAVAGGKQSGLILRLDAKRITSFFAVVVSLFLALHAVINGLRFALGNEKLYGLVYMFSVGADGNFPTYYSSFALLFAGLLLALISYMVSKMGRVHAGYWLGLGGVFCFLALDEMLELHERLIEPVRNLTHASGLLYYAWVIPYAVALLVLGLVYLRFMFNLPRRTAVWFILSGAVYVGGAVGFEMLGGLFFESYGSNTPGYVVLQTIEEAMEMIGIVMFIYALTDYICRELGGVEIRISN
jgi:hypothetical protein